MDPIQTVQIDATLQSAFDVVPEGVAIFDAEARCVFWNARYASQWAVWGVTVTPGARLADLLRAGLAAGRFPEAEGAAEVWIAERIRHLRQGLVTELRDEFGEHLRFETRPTPSGGFIITYLNITSLQRREVEAAATKGFLDTVVENVPAMLFVKDGETGKFLLVNRAGEQALGVARADLLGKNDADFFPPEQAAYFAACDRAVIDSGELVTVDEEPLDTPHNGRRWLHTRKIAVPFEDGRRHLLTICEDITERKASAAALAEALKRAEAASIAKSEFLANMSHEIRTPLNGVIGMAEVLSRTPLAPDQQDMMQVIVNSGRMLNLLLSDILDLSKIEAGALDLCEDPMDLREALTSAVSVFEAVAHEKDIGFALTFDEDFQDHVVGDALRLRQVVANLTSNAVKFTNDGKVGIHAVTHLRDDGRACLRVTVSDTGEGFDEDAGNRLFERFQQADGSVTRKIGGSGLGLAIARRLARMMDGDISWVSAPGNGASFTFEAVLAVGKALPAAASVAATVLQPRDQRLRVLLAEDHPVNQKVVILMLSDLADVVVAPDGQAAIEAFEAGAYDVILMDTQMPVLDGLAAIVRIRDRERALGARRTPIISLTANVMPQQVAACLAAGADLHLAKPISIEGLFASITLALEMAAATGSPVAVSA